MDQSTRVPRTRARTVRIPRPIPRSVLWFALVLFAYVVLILGVIRWSPFLTLDKDVFRLDLRQRYPEWFYPLHTYVMLGQRAPATLVALPWFAWRAWKSRSPRPLVMLGTALVVLNLSVGVVKVATGRLGPRATPHVHAVFEGGDIFPSGHVSNAVVLYGLIAMLAVSFRRAVMVAAVFVSITVGLCTVYLDTHWVSDVLGGWLAGVLVLLVLPWIMPYAERVAEMVIRWGRRRFTSRAKHRQPKHRAVPVAATRMPPPVHEQVYQGPEPVKAGGVRG
ncbi:MAG TPA: phosphatase PAP2 family protein [Jatrophihabitans sp.]